MKIINRKTKYILMSILAIILITQSVNAKSTVIQSNDDIKLASLGLSEEESDQHDVVIQEEGSLDKGNLKLILSSSEPMYKIRMTPPNSPAQQNQVALGESGIVHYAQGQELDVSYTAALGQSEGFTTEFAAPIAGIYAFDLYDENDQFIQTLSHQVRANTAINLALSSGLQFSLRKTLKVDLSYTPQIAGEVETLTVILPPYFRVTTLPTNGANYTVTALSGIPLPTDYYNDSDSDILKTYNLKCNGFKIEFTPAVTSTLAFNFSYAFNNDYTSIGRIMAAYGENPDRIPLRLVAFGMSASGTLIDSQIVDGSSIITDVDGNLIPESPPNTNTAGKYAINHDYLYDPPQWGRANRTIISVASWHYPITDIIMYTPVPDGTTSDTTLSVVEIKGNNYIELKAIDILAVNGSEFRQISAPVSPENQSSILTGQAFNFADALVSYTYRGQKYIHANSFGYVPYVVPDRLEVQDVGYYFRYNNAEGNTSVNRKQGQQGDVYNFAVGNHHGSKPSGTFNDGVVTFDFPFEVTPTAIKYDLGANGYGPPDNTAPKLIQYYVYGEATPRTITPPAATVGVYPTLAFPGSPHVTKIELLYDKIPPASRFEYWITANNGMEDESGAELDLSVDRQIIASITTPNGKVVYGEELPNREEVQFSFERRGDFKLIREVIAPPDPIEDSLYFGTRYTGTPHKGASLKMYQTATPQVGENAQVVMLRKTSKEMIDYKDIVITTKPRTEADKAGFSLVTGMYLNKLKPGNQVGTAKVSYLTNLKPTTWQVATRTTVNVDRDYYVFSLLEGEYPLEIKTEFDELYGSKMSAYLGSTANDNMANGIIENTSGDWNGIFLGYGGSYRKYFPGVADEEVMIKETDKWTFDNIITLSGSAKHIIDDRSGESFVNDNAPAVIEKYNLYGSGSLGRDNFASASLAPNTGNYYQGQTFRFYMRNNGTDLAARYGGGQFNYKLKYYLELYNDFELVEIENKHYTFLEARPIPANDTTLYIYEVSVSNNVASPWMKIRVRPDAVNRDGVPMIKAAGVSHTSFVEDNLLIDTGDDAYYNSLPYHKITMETERKFPVDWNSTDKLQYTYLAAVKVNIYYKFLDKIDLNSKIGTLVQQGEGDLKTHNLNDFSVEASIAGDIDAVISQYDALFTIPRTGVGGETPTVDDGGLIQQLDNDFDIYLKGPITTRYPEEEYNVTYYTDYDAKQTIDITSSSSEAELRSVTKILVSLLNLPSKATQIINIPLYATTKKTGEFTDVEHGYVGVSVSKKVDASMEPFVVQKALDFAYESYELSMRMGLDTDEDGRLRSLVGGVAEFEVFYNDGTNDVLLPSPTVVNNIHTIKVNDDVSHIKIKYLETANDKYLITAQNMSTLTEDVDSDFPRDAALGGQLKVLPSDLYSGTVNKYDVAFIIKPTLPIKDFTGVNSLAVPKGESISQIVDFRLSTTGAVIPARNQYKQTITNVADTTIANVSVNSLDKKIYAQGHSLGETTFIYTLTNRLGDEFVVDGVKVNVVRNLVAKATLRKAFSTGSINLGGDTFNVNLWNEGTATVPTNEIVVAGVNTVADVTAPVFVERGIKHYISEVSKTGYKTDGFEGIIDGVTIAFDYEGGGVYSFTPPITAKNVSITAKNKNDTADLILRKKLDAAALALNPDKEFTITVTEKGEPTPIVTATLKSGATKLVPDLVFGRTYVVEETTVVDYALDTVTLEKGEINTGTQPVSLSDNSYEFTLGVDNIGTEIVVYNQLAVGKGLEVSKHVNLDPKLPREDYRFILTHSNGNTSYGLVAKTETTFPAKVKWYSDASNTVEIDISELKIGQYVLKEEIGVNYEPDEFNIAQGDISPTSTYNNIIFVVTGDSILLKIDFANRVKEGGQVNVTKKVDPRFLEDTMAFTITHESSSRVFVSEAKVISDNFLFSSWKENGVVIAANKLPFGKYTITESVEGYHYVLKKFHPGTGLTVATNEKSASFTLSSTLTTANITAENTLTEKGSLRIKSVPRKLSYGSLPVGSTIMRHTDDTYVEIENTLRFPTNWMLTVTSSTQTATIDGGTVTLPYQILKYSKDGITYDSLSSQQMIMDQTEPKVGDIHRLDWTASDSTGIVADVWFHPATRTGEYSSAITWSLQQVP